MNPTPPDELPLGAAPGQQTVTPEQQSEAEEQIALHHKVLDYDTREYPVEVLVDKYLKGLNEDDNDLFIPDYQRDLVWPEDHQSRFIESVLMGLPIPYLFVADVKGQEGRIEVVDGSQRVRTLAAFMQDELCLQGLQKLTALNGFRYSDLPRPRRRRFGRHTIRMIELTEEANEDSRRDIFKRINTGSLKLTPMEVRWGSSDGRFLKFIRELSGQPLFEKLAPLGEGAVKRRDRQEFVLRFFAYLNDYHGFERSVIDFLNDYLKSVEEGIDDTRIQGMRTEWERMLAFVDQYFRNGFSKAKGHVRTPRIRFEAIAVGTALALRVNPDLQHPRTDWLDTPEFLSLTTSGASNSRPKLIKRIEFVRDNLLRP